MTAVVLPELTWDPTTACGPRNGHRVSLVVVHRWGVRYTTPAGEAHSYQGVIDYFKDRSHQASAHVVYPGSAVPGEATQMVRWSDYAWAEAAFNPAADEVESADHIWVPDAHGKYDEAGLEQLARIVAYRLYVRRLPAVWSHQRGFCRHADLGAAGGGHTQCPTTDMKRWRHFVARVQYQHELAGWRPAWGHV